VQQLQINRFFLAGHSLGGAIAQEYARRFPQKVQGSYLLAVACSSWLLLIILKP